MIRRIFHVLSYLVIIPLVPFKVYAYRTRFAFLRRLILTFTTLIDFVLIWLNIQNETMLLHWRIYNGNFIFGRGIMVTDYQSAAEAIVKPVLKGNNFMGVNIVSSDCSAFGTNTGILNQCPPIRNSTRAYLDEAIFTPPVMALDLDTVHSQTHEILGDWASGPNMANMLMVRSTATRLFLKILSNITITKEDADTVTFQYMRRFVELSLFSGYLPIVCDLLGTHKHVRKDAYLKLKQYGIDLMTIDITLFAAMFSIGTLVIRCVEDTRRFDISYPDLDYRQKRHFVIEAVRLYPTVTSVHRIVETPETVRVWNRDLQLTPGDEVVYPFICCNRDPAHFPDPAKMDLNRSDEEYEKVLSWSKGVHSCPAKELSILVTMLMLDELAKKFDLRKLSIFNPAF